MLEKNSLSKVINILNGNVSDNIKDAVLEILKARIDLLNSQKAGSPKPKKTDIKKHIAGRERLIYKLGRTQYVRIKGSFKTLKEARKN